MVPGNNFPTDIQGAISPICAKAGSVDHIKPVIKILLYLFMHQ
jgi:hypothetical protein